MSSRTWHKETDPALRIVERVIADSPACRARVVFGENPDLINPKIANIAKDGVITSRDIVVIADSDIRVGREYLRALAADFESQAVGAVTCLCSGTPSDNFISRLGALGIDDGFAPSVLVALRLGELRFTLGATMAVRGTLLPVIGGLTALGNTFADDYELGQLVTRKGFRVQLSRYVVTTTVPETKFGELWAHELRWARTEFELARADLRVLVSHLRAADGAHLLRHFAQSGRGADSSGDRRSVTLDGSYACLQGAWRYRADRFLAHSPTGFYEPRNLRGQLVRSPAHISVAFASRNATCSGAEAWGPRVQPRRARVPRRSQRSKGDRCLPQVEGS